MFSGLFRNTMYIMFCIFQKIEIHSFKVDKTSSSNWKEGEHGLKQFLNLFLID